MSAPDRLIPARILWSLGALTIADMLRRTLWALDQQFRVDADFASSLVAQLAGFGRLSIGLAIVAVWGLVLYALALIWAEPLLGLTRRMLRR